MPKLSTPLSDTRIRNAKPADKMYKLSDGAGLALWIYPNGRKVWRIQYRRPADGKFDTITFGHTLKPIKRESQHCAFSMQSNITPRCKVMLQHAPGHDF